MMMLFISLNQETSANVCPEGDLDPNLSFQVVICAANLNDINKYYCWSQVDIDVDLDLGGFAPC